MAKWFYYDSFGNKKGPVTNDDLKSLIGRGVVTPQTIVGADGEQYFFPAGQVDGLFTQQPQYSHPQLNNNVSISPPPDYLIWSAITTFMCLPLGVIAVVMSILAKSAFRAGDYADAKSKSTTAFWCNLIGTIGFVLYIIAIVIFVAISIIYEAHVTNS
ncbi:MAG: CD225/dispanin family protein [Planctomycetaceae bacterium]|jgi:hypothetical protein|nr:CD225/dispanin family protein [Planctomycetaceae bacterium]